MVHSNKKLVPIQAMIERVKGFHDTQQLATRGAISLFRFTEHIAAVGNDSPPAILFL